MGLLPFLRIAPCTFGHVAAYCDSRSAVYYSVFSRLDSICNNAFVTLASCRFPVRFDFGGHTVHDKATTKRLAYCFEICHDNGGALWKSRSFSRFPSLFMTISSSEARTIWNSSPGGNLMLAPSSVGRQSLAAAAHSAYIFSAL